MTGTVDQAVQRYERERDRYEKMANVVFEKCRAIVIELNVRATVQRRTKDPESLRRKLRSWSSDPAKQARVSTVDEVFANIGDLAAVRVTTYQESDREVVVQKICEAFGGAGPENRPIVDKKDGNAAGAHYRATHCQVALATDGLDAAYENLRGDSCEVQVCSLLAHVWNEIEHDLRYKPQLGDLELSEHDLIEQLGQLTRAGDIAISQLLAATVRRRSQESRNDDPFEDAHDLVARTRGWFANSSRFGTHSVQLYEELVGLSLNTSRLVRTELNVPASPDAEALRVLEALERACAGYQVTIDRESSDLLLAYLLKSRAREIVERHPAGPGLGRPTRLVLLARRYVELES